jgi:hypothetical protein
MDDLYSYFFTLMRYYFNFYLILNILFIECFILKLILCFIFLVILIINIIIHLIKKIYLYFKSIYKKITSKNIITYI